MSSEQLPLFGGFTFVAERDAARLTAQLGAVRDYMASHGGWRTLREIADATGYPEASISARLRDLRKVRFGAHTVDRRYLTDGLWEYRLQLRKGR
jgi:hypothetical protein